MRVTSTPELDAIAAPRPQDEPWVCGPRARFAVIAPSTNTVVEQDFAAIRPDGVTFHTGRMFIENPNLGSNEDFESLLTQIRASITTAIRDVMTSKPTYMLMGMSAETFWGGVAGNQAFIDRVSKQSGLDVSTGASACRAALDHYSAERIAVFSPYQPIADDQVSNYFTEAGFAVAAVTGLRCPTATAIAEVGPDRLARLVEALDGPGIDAIVQVGTNLSFVAQAARMETDLGKPVIAINAATLWHALRAVGVTDRIDGFGRILTDA